MSDYEGARTYSVNLQDSLHGRICDWKVTNASLLHGELNDPEHLMVFSTFMSPKWIQSHMGKLFGWVGGHSPVHM